MTTDLVLPAGADEIALVAAGRAGDFIRSRFRDRSDCQVEQKGRNDFVTGIDREAERLIVETLRRQFPHHSFLAEEGGGGLPQGEYCWVIDPLDGTTNFIHGIPACAVSIALRAGGRTLLGVVHNPLYAETFLAVRGRGATRNGRILECSKAGAITGALGATGFPFKQPAAIPAYLSFLGELLPRARDLRRCGSAALDLAYTAAGIYDFFFEAQLFPWDFMAGVLLIEEAGGRVSDFSGGDPGCRETSILAAGPALHPLLLAEVRPHFSPPPSD